jgi:hypothetical protein
MIYSTQRVVKCEVVVTLLNVILVISSPKLSFEERDIFKINYLMILRIIIKIY